MTGGKTVQAVACAIAARGCDTGNVGTDNTTGLNVAQCAVAELLVPSRGRAEFRPARLDLYLVCRSRTRVGIRIGIQEVVTGPDFIRYGNVDRELCGVG